MIETQKTVEFGMPRSNLKKVSGSNQLQVEIGSKYMYTGSMHAAALYHQQLPN